MGSRLQITFLGTFGIEAPCGACSAAVRSWLAAVDKPLVTQYRTDGVDKSATMTLQYALRLREKHKSYLRDRGLYRASRAMARAQFHGGKGRIWASRAYALIACAMSPVFFWEILVSRAGGLSEIRALLGRWRADSKIRSKWSSKSNHG